MKMGESCSLVGNPEEEHSLETQTLDEKIILK
jgi:hypothetical protein